MGGSLSGTLFGTANLNLTKSTLKKRKWAVATMALSVRCLSPDPHCRRTYTLTTTAAAA